MSGVPPPYLGLGGRLGVGPAAVLVETGFALEIADAPVLHDGFALADLAHTLELADAGVLDEATTAGLTGHLLDMDAVAAADFPYDAAFGDPWNSRERVLDERAGPPAGWLWVGRPRREAARVALRLALRRLVLDAHAALLELGSAYLDQGRRHRRTLMSDFTYLQPAQPTSLGYLMVGHLQPVLRHLDRLETAYRWINLSPAGAGGTTGTSLPLDRARLARRLGFDGVIEHARDAMWQADGLADLLGTLATSATEGGQVASDLEIWASGAFGFVELADGFCRVSALMPQKKNPYALAVVRQGAGSLTGALTGLLVALRTPTARTDHFLFAPGEVFRALGTYMGTTRLLAGVIATLDAKPEALARSVADPSLYLGDLADEIVRGGYTDRRSAHRLLGEAARAAREAGRPVGPADVVEAGRRAGVDLPAGLAGRLGDPVGLLESRTIEGGWARLPDMIRSAGRGLRRHHQWADRIRSEIDAAEATLRTEAAARSGRQEGGRV